MIDYCYRGAEHELYQLASVLLVAPLGVIVRSSQVAAYLGFVSSGVEVATKQMSHERRCLAVFMSRERQFVSVENGHMG